MQKTGDITLHTRNHGPDAIRGRSSGMVGSHLGHRKQNWLTPLLFNTLLTSGHSGHSKYKYRVQKYKKGSKYTTYIPGSGHPDVTVTTLTTVDDPRSLPRSLPAADCVCPGIPNEHTAISGMCERLCPWAFPKTPTVPSRGWQWSWRSRQIYRTTGQVRWWL